MKNELMNRKCNTSERKQEYNLYKLLALCFIFLIISLSLTSCSLDRKNPLDPKNNPKITVPNQISGIELQASPRSAPTKWVKIEWQKDPSVDGYYIYKGLSRESQFSEIEDINNNEINEHTDNDVYPGVFWYRVSAYIKYPDKNDPDRRLEGPLSPLTEKSAIEVRE